MLNAQRMRIYEQRNRVFEKDDLAEDVDELLRAEVEHRVGEATSSEEFWRLLAWLDQIQPPVQVGSRIFPSFTYRLLLDEVSKSSSETETAFLGLAENALQAAHDHFLTWGLDQVDRAGEAFKTQLDERSESLDTFLDALKDRDESDTRRPQELAEELANTIHMPLRLSNEQAVQLVNDPGSLVKPLKAAIGSALNALILSRLVATLEYRLGEPFGVNLSELQSLSWDDASARIEARLHTALDERQSRLLGADGQVVRDVRAFLERNPVADEQTNLRLLMTMAQGWRAAFDPKTHRQVRQVFTRLVYIHHAGEILRRSDTQKLEARVLEHLNQARAALQGTFQEAEATRLGVPVNSAQMVESGRRIQNQIYRQVLLGAITELWVDYLTRVEALRVSVGLEAYAQRDPLVQYKSQASMMFQNLLADIRGAVISRIFLYRPRTATVNVDLPEIPSPETGTAGKQGSGQAQGTSSDKKRKRHRH